jgi:hypothetical protein
VAVILTNVGISHWLFVSLSLNEQSRYTWYIAGKIPFPLRNEREREREMSLGSIP